MSKNLQAFLAFLFVFLVMVASQSSHAAYTVTPAVEGLTGNFYKPLTNPALNGTNFVANGKILINGKFISIPGYMPQAADAASQSKIGMWLNPWITAAPLLLWAGDVGLYSDDHGGWMYQDPLANMVYLNRNVPTVSYVSGCRASSVPPGYVYCDASMQECIFNYRPLTDGRACIAVEYETTAPKILGAYAEYNQPYTGADSWRNIEYQPYGDCPEGSSPITGSANCEIGPQPREATVEDFEQFLPDPVVEIQEHPLVLVELARIIGLFMDAMVYDYNRVQIGDPYVRPDGVTVTPMATISPASNGQVTVDTYNQPTAGADGVPYPENELPAPVDTPDYPPTPEGATDNNQCDKYPSSLGCANLDIPNSENLPSEARNVALISPVSIGGAGACPAPLTASFLGQTVEMKFDPLCQFANSLRPVVLVLAWLSAGIIFIGGVRNG